jgi:Uma2 family endonuclease
MKVETLTTPVTFEELVEMADEVGVKLEITAGIPTWEAFPGSRHQKAVLRALMSVERSATPDCGCFQLPDVYIKFPDGSLKRPDIAIFCEEPPEQDEALEQIPEAVLEVLSKDYEKKDTEIGAPFYLEQGVKDVILFDPRTMEVTHRRRDGTRLYKSPVKLKLECGCQITV